MDGLRGLNPPCGGSTDVRPEAVQQSKAAERNFSRNAEPGGCWENWLEKRLKLENKINRVRL